MIRILWFLITGFWLLPSKRQLMCTKSTCRARQTGCKSEYCLFHCAEHCYCGVGSMAKLNDAQMLKEMKQLNK